MLFWGILRIFWLCFLLSDFGACVPIKKVPGQTSPDVATGGAGTASGFGFGFSGVGSTGAGSGARYGYSSGGAGAGGIASSSAESSFTSGGGPGSNAGSWAQSDEEIGNFIARLMRFQPQRPFPSFAWSSDQVPLGTIAAKPVVPSSHTVRSSNGYQRARNLQTAAKYAMDTFDHIPLDLQQGADSKGQKTI